MMSKTILAAALMAVALLGVSFAASADSGHGHNTDESKKFEADNKDGGEHHEASEGHGGHSDMKVSSPAAAWSALMTARDAIASDIERGELADIHEKSEPLSALAVALLDQSGDLEANKHARVEGAVKQVARVADALHTSADREDVARTRKQLARLDGLLKLIKAQYAAGSLEAEDHETHKHGKHSAAPALTNEPGAHAHRMRPAGVIDDAPQAIVRVRADDALRFEPRRIEIQAGVPTQIELENTGALEHSLVVKTPDGERDWVHIHVPPGMTDRDTYQLDAPGTYALRCSIAGHTEAGMVGELVVLAGHDKASPGKHAQ